MKRIIAIALFLLIAGCNQNVLFPSDSGKTLNLRIGEQFTLKLPENPSTGYQWEIETEPQYQFVVSQVENQFIAARTAALGVGGERVITYQAKNLGSVEIKGFHQRSWGKSSHDEPSVQYKIIVR